VTAFCPDARALQGALSALCQTQTEWPCVSLSTTHEGEAVDRQAPTCHGPQASHTV